MTILTETSELQKVKEAARIVKGALDLAEGRVREGVSTADLDREVEDFICREGGEPAFKGYKGYPASICASVNEVVVHGIPSDDVVLNSGDIVSVDVGVKKNGYFADAARTFPVGEISDEAKDLIAVTKDCLAEGMKQAVEGNRVSDISHAIEKTVKKSGYKEVRAFVGHGIGTRLHESPEVPNWGEPGKGVLLKEGLLLAIEPMVNMGTRQIEVMGDGWTAVTKDGRLSAHFEHTVIVGKEKAEALT